MSLVKGMTFKMSQAAKTIGKEHFRHRCRAQGIPLYFSRIDHKWSQIFGEGQRFERHATRGDNFARSSVSSLKVSIKRKFFISLFERAFKMMKNGVYFIVIALLVAELFKILIYAN